METATTYQKHNSFHELHVAEGKTNPAEQSARGKKILANFKSKTEQEGYVLDQVFEDLHGTNQNRIRFSITPFIADEMRLIEDSIPRYLFHRYRYEIILNYTSWTIIHRTYKSNLLPFATIAVCSVIRQMRVSLKKNRSHGAMSLEMYKQIVNQVWGILNFYHLLPR